jgi:type I restriction enzyme S subunit
MAFEQHKISKITNNLDSKRIPLNEQQRKLKESRQLYPYIGANNILGYIDEYIFDEKILCLAEDGGSWGANEKCAFIINEKCWVNNHAHVLTAKENLHLEYLCYYLNFTSLNKFITGATRGKLTQSALNSIDVPLPTLAEQQRIAKILDAADALRKKTQQIIDSYDELAQSVFLDMFGDPVKNEKGWEKKPFDYFAKIDTKMTTDFEKYSEYPHIGIANIEKDSGKLVDYKKVSEENLSSGKYLFTKNHIIYSKIRPNLNKVALPDFDGLCSADSYPILVHRKNSNKYFFTFLLRSKSFLDFILSHSKRTNIPKANKEQMQKYQGIAPPVILQNQFSEKFELIEKQKELAKQSLIESDDLFNALLQKAFKGELSN